ncbi:MAG: SirB2 family protein [Gammaproteobacteria bacterium]|nr:SirB2 family protein [Gammaproteobacteria bacterium]
MQWIVNNYAVIKVVHVMCVIASAGLFFLRGIWVIQESGNLALRWVRTTPHIIDTVLLLSAGLLSIGLQQYPFADNWLTAKVIALLVYIGLGMMAIRHGHNRQIRIFSWFAALIVLAYIIGVAITRSPVLGLFS